MLRTRPGAEGALEWSLPLAAGDPLFGLPPLPPKPLPDSPYQRALDYYTRDLAELFFGRSREIRDLYQRVTAAGRSRVILYYGQSGVGKSSLLDAGLAPRLEATHAVSYARRDRALGLLGTLRKQLAITDAAQGLIDSTAWLAAEQHARKPLVLILDQVEEVFTRRNPDQPHELEEFAAALRSVDAPATAVPEGGAATRPAGVLLLGFRKERLAEIESALRSESIDFAKVFLAPLDEEGIQDAFWGPVHNERLAAKYGLTIEDQLPAIVAHDLTADPDSPVAPTLNILLRKLWAAATTQNASAPHFSVTLYEQLRRDGILLDDFLRQQTATLAEEYPDAVASGFVTDLWAFHTTDLGTADQRTTAELQAAYPHREDLDTVVLRSKELYVLADLPGDSATAEGGTRLAHDTLAPLVRRDYDHSAHPAQQAARLLESRAVDWSDGRTGALLDDSALVLVDKGVGGMRILTADEQRLLAASHAAQAQRKRQRRFWRTAAAVAGGMILGLLAIALLLWNNQQVVTAEKESAVAKAQLEAERATRVDAQRQASEERNRSAELNNQLTRQRELAAARLAQANDSQRLAELSQQQLAVDPVVSLHLALAALPSATGQPLVPDAEFALRQAALTSRERKYISVTVDGPDAIAIRGNRVAVGGAAPIVYDIELNPQEFPLPPDFKDIHGLRWGNDGRLLGWNDTTAWVTGGGEPLRFSLDAEGLAVPDDSIQCAEWQPAQRWVAICTFNSLYAWQPESGRIITLTTQLDTPDLPTAPRSATWSSDGRRLAGLGARLAVWDSRAPQTPAEVFYPPTEPGQPLSFAAWLPDDTALVAGWFAPGAADLALQQWQPEAKQLQAIPLPGDFSEHFAGMETLYVPDPESGAPRLLLWSNDGFLALYGTDGRQIAAATDTLADLNGVSLSPNGDMVAGYSAGGGAAIWQLSDLSLVTALNVANGFTAGSLTHLDWLDSDTLALYDENGLLQVAQHLDSSSSLAVTPLYGYRAADHIARAMRLANGRLLTAGYGGDGASSLRIWQIAPVPTLTGEGLPTAADPLCRRLQRTVALPQGMGRPTVLAWRLPGDLLTAGRDGEVAHWTIGSTAEVLPADKDRPTIVVAPDARRVLRYGSGVDGQIWRLDASGWVQDGTLPDGELADASWTDYGMLAEFADGSAAVIDPATGGRQGVPADAAVSGSVLLTGDLLVAQRPAAVELWRLGAAQPMAGWPIPPNRSLRLDDMVKEGALDGQDSAGNTVLLVYRDRAFGQLYVLRADVAAHTLTEVWRSEQAHVDSAPARLNRTMPLLATVNDSVVSLIDLAQGQVIWQSTGVGAVAGQMFRAVLWSTDGQYLITQAQPLQQSSFNRNIGVWRWHTEQRRPILVQEVPSSGLLGVSPDTSALLAGEPGQPFADRPYFYPVLADTGQLQADVQASCLLDRQLNDELRQAFLISGR